jgi:hypothetical protein
MRHFLSACANSEVAPQGRLRFALTSEVNQPRRLATSPHSLGQGFGRSVPDWFGQSQKRTVTGATKDVLEKEVKPLGRSAEQRCVKEAAVAESSHGPP